MSMTFRSVGTRARRVIPAVLSAFLMSLAAPVALAVAPQKRRSGLKRMMALGAKYFKKKNYSQAFRVWQKVSDKLVEVKFYERPGKAPIVARIRYMAGYALFKAKKYQNATRYWRQTLSLEANHPKAMKGLRRLAKAGIIGKEEVAPDPDFPVKKAPPPPTAEPPPVATAEPAAETPVDPVVEKEDILADITVKVDTAAASESWTEGKRLLKYGKAEEAIDHFVAAYTHGKRRPDIDYKLARAFLKNEEPVKAIFHFNRVLEAGEEDEQEVHLGLGKAHSLSNDVAKEIQSYEHILNLNPDNGEAHFMLALAYDKVDNSPKVLEHAQKAIRINPDFKERLKPRIKDSNVSKKIGRIVSNVLKDSKYERLTDEKIDEYAEEIGRILGEENLGGNDFVNGGTGRQKMKDVLMDVREGKDFKKALDKHVPKDKQRELKRSFIKSKRLKSLVKQVRTQAKNQ